jgi:hypothetical protein
VLVPVKGTMSRDARLSLTRALRTVNGGIPVEMLTGTVPA